MSALVTIDGRPAADSVEDVASCATQSDGLHDARLAWVTLRGPELKQWRKKFAERAPKRWQEKFGKLSPKLPAALVLPDWWEKEFGDRWGWDPTSWAEPDEGTIANWSKHWSAIVKQTLRLDALECDAISWNPALSECWRTLFGVNWWRSVAPFVCWMPEQNPTLRPRKVSKSWLAPLPGALVDAGGYKHWSNPKFEGRPWFVNDNPMVASEWIGEVPENPDVLLSDWTTKYGKQHNEVEGSELRPTDARSSSSRSHREHRTSRPRT